MYPEFQDKVVAELKEVIQEKGTYINRNHIESLTYLERCIKEAMRLYPVVTLLGRRCDAPFKLRDYEIVPGMAVAIGVQQLHHNPKYWGPNPTKFNPDNFLPEAVKQRSPFCYIPFSEGSRNCIGKFHLYCYY